MPRIFIALVALGLFAMPVRAEDDATLRARAKANIDRFQLWNDCRPMGLIVERLNSDSEKIGLTKEAIEVAVRSRLRSARLFSDDIPKIYYLYINVNVKNRAFNISVDYEKPLYDTKSEITQIATTWSKGMVGVHGGDANYILSGVSQKTDQFIDEYLRVNADACGR